MSRLIDADKLKVYLKEYLHYDHAIPWVDAQPTAYDIEKVVAELVYQAKLQEYLRQNASARCNDAQAHIHRYAEQCYRNKAIEIVRKGGVEC